MPERGAPERRRKLPKQAERDIQPAPSWERPEHNMLLDADGALGCVLWQRWRDVRLWAAAGKQQTPPAHLFVTQSALRRKLHSSAVVEEPAIQGALNTLLQMVGQPHLTERESVCGACLEISEWASDRNLVETALAYAEAAASADPRCAEAAAVAGMACLRVSPATGECLDIRASVWLRRAARIARRSKDWEWYIRAHIRLGLLLYQLGEFRAARKMYDRSAWMADWYGRVELAGKAHHDLLAIEGDIGTFDAAFTEAQHALTLYPVRHDRIPFLIHDIAFYAFVRFGFFRAARELISTVWEHIPEGNRLIINGTFARVSGALHDRAAYESAASRVSILAELSQEGATWAHIHIAEGARSLSEWDRAEAYAARALDLALRRRELDAQRTAYTLLDAIMVRTPGPRETSPDKRVSVLLAACLERLGKLREPAEAAIPARQVVTTAWAP